MGIASTDYGSLTSESMGTQSVQIDTGVMNIVREIKEKLGFPIGRFIEDSIMEKVHRLPKKSKEKIGLHKPLNKTSKK